ncbi:hypothetical protein Y028_3136 [Burkholderia pseudomallei MSHR62]|uniref:hypothetical protein n=1 Tax=Burkholderia pseudomallei TaxID=28450 RepID=UPI00052A9999|nr:hypothetical protein [Burkholderia pseudomallei]AIV70207.1 hypothetical protein Y028_3136 [Burkholderia pseudomallei MSHR62]
MALEAIYSFLTYPKRNSPEEPLAPGTQIPVDEDNKLVRMLADLYARAPNDCHVPIKFRADNDDQTNPVRNELIVLLAAPSVESAAPIALRLQKTTGGNSGMGLMFICIGVEGDVTRLLISRFPADEGVVAERKEAELTVQFVEQVFLKSAHAYKAAAFHANGRPDQLWTGHIVDRQLNHGSRSVADYWIVAFLEAEEATTPALGTKRLAKTLKKALSESDDINVKQEITAAAQLAGGIPPRRSLSIAQFCEHFHFSPATIDLVLKCIDPPRLAEDKFRFDPHEFAQHLAYRQVELNNGAILTAPADRFDQIYERQKRRAGETFSTTGEVIDQKLKTSK